MKITNEKIIITGGAGFLGKSCIDHWYDNNELVIYSRDEAKHYFLKKKYPKIKTVIGDIRDKNNLLQASKNCTLGVFAASLKQIEACDENPSEAVKTILLGALNSREVADECNMKSATFISSDKSRAATTLYGSLKFAAGECFILNPCQTKVTSAIYGNVLNSTGSILPLIWEKIKTNDALILYSAEMTRFVITVEDAVGVIEKSFLHSGVSIIPKLKSFSILDLFEIFSEKFGLQYQIGIPRIGEKIHEIMSSPEEVRRLKYLEKEEIYILHPKEEYNQVKFKSEEYSSKDCVMSKNELKLLLERYDYFKPGNFSPWT
jgi:UDP-glucose 4-epimerase